MKLAITGKGGVGKTTLTALLAQVYADAGRDVLAVDGTLVPVWQGRWVSRLSCVKNYIPSPRWMT